MSIMQDIVLLMRQLRRMPDIDVERLSYTLNDAEWTEFARELDSVTFLPRQHAVWEGEPVIFYGITVRKEKGPDRDPGRLPLRIEVRGL